MSRTHTTSYKVKPQTTKIRGAFARPSEMATQAPNDPGVRHDNRWLIGSIEPRISVVASSDR